jgi:outer membrane biosynthesis protein TonB
MKRALSAVQVCNEKFAETGTITVEVSIEPAGRISKGKVLGAFSGSAVADCVLDAVKRHASFPAFSGATLVVKYPFVLRSN